MQQVQLDAGAPEEIELLTPKFVVWCSRTPTMSSTPKPRDVFTTEARVSS